MAEQNFAVDKKGAEKIGTESSPESKGKETKLELAEHEENSEEEKLSAGNLSFIVIALMLCVFLVCACIFELYARSYIHLTIRYLFVLY